VGVTAFLFHSFEALVKSKVKHLSNVLVYPFVEAAFILDQGFQLSLHFVVILVLQLFVEKDLLESLLSDLQYSRLGKLSRKMLSGPLNRQCFVSHIDSMFSKALLGLLIKVLMSPRVRRSLFVDPNAHELVKTSEPVAGWQQGVSNCANIDLVHVLVWLKVPGDFAFGNGLGKTGVFAVFAPLDVAGVLQDFAATDLDVLIAHSVERAVDFHFHAAGVVHVACSVHHLARDLHRDH
jgi:hypothetical protein